MRSVMAKSAGFVNLLGVVINIIRRNKAYECIIINNWYEN